MNFTGSTKNYFTKWNDFSSRISRSEYWWGYLGIILISLVFGFTVGLTLVIMGASEGQINLAILPFQLFTLIASLSLAAWKYFHDFRYKFKAFFSKVYIFNPMIISSLCLNNKTSFFKRVKNCLYFSK